MKCCAAAIAVVVVFLIGGVCFSRELPLKHRIVLMEYFVKRQFMLYDYAEFLVQKRLLEQKCREVSIWSTYEVKELQSGVNEFSRLGRKVLDEIDEFRFKSFLLRCTDDAAQLTKEWSVIQQKLITTLDFIDQCMATAQEKCRKNKD